MLTHIVIWKYRDDVPQGTREVHISLLRHLPGVISEIRSFSIGFDVLHLPRSYDMGLVATFDDREGLATYTNHPEHLKAAAMSKDISAHIASVDFES
jgi:hypothetical protein